MQLARAPKRAAEGGGGRADPGGFPFNSKRPRETRSGGGGGGEEEEAEQAGGVDKYSKLQEVWDTPLEAGEEEEGGGGGGGDGEGGKVEEEEAGGVGEWQSASSRF
jgi:hypothetical protein